MGSNRTNQIEQRLCRGHRIDARQMPAATLGKLDRFRAR
jgi:hypothetical protein